MWSSSSYSSCFICQPKLVVDAQWKCYERCSPITTNSFPNASLPRGVYLEDNFRWCGLLLNSNSIVHQRFGDEKCIVSTSVFHNSSIIESLMLATDNATVVVYLINQGGTHCHVLFLLCKEIQRLSSALFSSGSQTHSRDLQCLSRSFWLLHNSIVGPSSFEPL